MRRYKIFKEDLEQFMKDVTTAMVKSNHFLNVAVKPCKDDDRRVVVKVG